MIRKYLAIIGQILFSLNFNFYNGNLTNSVGNNCQVLMHTALKFVPSKILSDGICYRRKIQQDAVGKVNRVKEISIREKDGL